MKQEHAGLQDIGPEKPWCGDRNPSVTETGPGHFAACSVNCTVPPTSTSEGVAVSDSPLGGAGAAVTGAARGVLLRRRAVRKRERKIRGSASCLRGSRLTGEYSTPVITATLFLRVEPFPPPRHQA
jgi:hypothetical protein